MYDCTEDVKNHIRAVQIFVELITNRLEYRARVHDQSKLEEPEKSMYDTFTPMLQGLTYGSEEYETCRNQMGVALDHHYKVNSHHPEHHEKGVSGMSLLDLIEMLADWKAATLRHADGDIQKSLSVNRERFEISDQLAEILQNTVKELGW